MNEGKWSIKRRRAPTTLPGKGGASNLAPGPAYLFAISQSGDGVRRQITFMACLQYDRARAVYSPVPASPTWQRAGPRPNAPSIYIYLHIGRLHAARNSFLMTRRIGCTASVRWAHKKRRPQKVRCRKKDGHARALSRAAEPGREERKIDLLSSVVPK